MELLSPAGSPIQAEAAIDAGCDALYGGLRQWNARNRASNFTVEQYHEILDKCANAGVRFYLTLNTLMREVELGEVLDLLHSGGIRMPDAVIATDLGFIQSLHRQFPGLDIHASTQFGASSVDDIRLLEELGAKRVILARELTLSEIDQIKVSTALEIEVFVYGSQCVAFSGQCLWGGLLNGSSGNRGRCIGMCRDLYRNHSKIGQFLYPQDIHAVGRIEQLLEIGVDSVKIEGRLRSAEEIAKTVCEFRQAINQGNVMGKYAGYLDNTLPVQGMFHSVNPRTTASIVALSNFSAADLLLYHGNESESEYIRGDNPLSIQNCTYVKTIFNRALLSHCANISLKLILENGNISKIDFINTDGERQLYTLENKKSTKAKVSEVHRFLNEMVKGNIYEFISSLPANQVVEVDFPSLRRIAEDINQVCATSGFVEVFHKALSLSVEQGIVFETDRLDVIHELADFGYMDFVYTIKDYDRLVRDLASARQDLAITYKLPLLDFCNQLESILKVLQGKPVMVSKLSQLLGVRRGRHSKIIAEYTINAWNKKTLSYLLDNGVTGVTLHPELSVREGLEVLATEPVDLQAIYYGKIPIGLTRACFGELGICSLDCQGVCCELENISKGYSLQIIGNNTFGFRNLYPKTKFAAMALPDDYLVKRVVLTDFEDSGLQRLLECAKTGESILDGSETGIYVGSVK